MAKQLTFEYNGTPYVLEYTRDTVKQMEKNGFVASDIDVKPMTVLPALFEGAFLAHHRFIKKELVNEIYGKLHDKEHLIESLAEMYNEPISALLDEPEEGNLQWTPNW